MVYPGSSEQNPRQQGGWQPYPQQAPPANGRTGLAVGILIAMVALVAFCVTGFAAPGFLLGKSGEIAAPVPSSSPAPTSAPTSSTSTTRSSRPRTVTRRPAPQPPEKGVQVIKDFLGKIAGSDRVGATGLACEQQKRFMDDKIDSLLPLGSRVEITKTSGTSRFVLADVAGTAEGRAVKGTMIADRKDADEFCITTFSIRDAY